MSVWAVVPVNDLHAAKSRLGGVLDDDAREKLARALCQHVLRVLCASPAVDGVVVLTPSVEVAKLARSRGAQVRLDPPGERQRLGVLVDAALSELSLRGATGAIVLMSDLPRLQAADVEALVAGLEGADVVIAPDRHELGTNALALRIAPGNAPVTSFGHADSFSRHAAAAAAAGRSVEVLRTASLALDVDLPDDLQLLSSTTARRAGTANPASRP